MESALSRPRNLLEHGNTDLYHLAAAYAFGIIRNHPVADGNKRTGLVVAATFLLLNGEELNAPEVEAATRILEVASGSIDEKTLAAWLRVNKKGMEG